MNSELVIINNESVHQKENNFYCDNIAIKSVSEGLNKNFKITTILRKSKIKRSHKINLTKIKLASNLFLFLLSIFKTFKKKNTKYLLVSITPYTFFAHLLLLIFKKKIFVYLRSNGYEEYKAIFGFIGPLIYHFMFSLVKFKSKIIVCQKRLLNKKDHHLVYPSELENAWFNEIKNAKLDKPRLLYVGRIKIEKGIFSLIKILEESEIDFELSIVGKPDELKLKNKKINYLGYIEDPKKLIEIYDKHNIFILPSFTEAHPQVVDESLARFRPVIIFEEINHIIQNRSGILTAKRTFQSLSEKINLVMENYPEIKKKMSTNKLPTKQQFISQMTAILN